MVRYIVFVVACLLLLVGCGLTPTATLLTGQNVEFEETTTEYVGRLGVLVEQTEFGFASNWWTRTEENQHAYGVYVLQKLINDPNMPILGGSYIGAQALVTVDLDNDGGKYGPILGTTVNIGGVEILTEFHYVWYNDALEAALQEGTSDEYKIYVGPRFKF